MGTGFDIRMFYIIVGLVVVLLLLLASFIISAKRASRLENTLDELTERLRDRDDDNSPVSFDGSDSASRSGPVSAADVRVTDAEGQEQTLDEALASISDSIAEAQEAQKQSYENIMADQQSLKESISQLKTLLSALPTTALAQAAAAAQGQNSAAEQGAAAGENGMVNAAMQAVPAAANGTVVNDLSAQDVSYPEGALGVAAQQREVNAALAASANDPDYQADLAFAQAANNNSGNNGAFAQSLNRPLNGAAAYAALQAQGNASGYGTVPDYSDSSQEQLAQGAGRGAHAAGRDPRNPLGMGNYGVSSPKEDGANAEASVSAQAPASFDSTVADSSDRADQAASAANTASDESVATATSTSSVTTASISLSADDDDEQAIEVEIRPQSVSDHSLAKAHAYAAAQQVKRAASTANTKVSENESTVSTASAATVEADAAQSATPAVTAPVASATAASAAAPNVPVANASSLSLSLQPQIAEDDNEPLPVTPAASFINTTTVSADGTTIVSTNNSLLTVTPAAAVVNMPDTPSVSAQAQEESQLVAEQLEKQGRPDDSTPLVVADVQVSSVEADAASDDLRFDALRSLTANYQQQLSAQGDRAQSSRPDTGSITAAASAINAAADKDDSDSVSIITAASVGTASTANATGAGAGADLVLPHNGSDLDDEGLSFAIAAARSSGNGGHKQISGTQGAHTVVDMIFDEDYVRKQQKDRPNGIDIKILDKAHTFIAAGVPLAEISAKTGLSEDELRILYDMDAHERDLAISASAADFGDDELTSPDDTADTAERAAAAAAATAAAEDDSTTAHSDVSSAAATASESKRSGSGKRRRRSRVRDESNPASALDQAEQEEIASMMQKKEDPFAHLEQRSEDDDDDVSLEAEEDSLHTAARAARRDTASEATSTASAVARSYDMAEAEEHTRELAEHEDEKEALARSFHSSRQQRRQERQERQERYQTESYSEEAESTVSASAATSSDDDLILNSSDQEFAQSLEAIDRLADRIIEKNRGQRHVAAMSRSTSARDSAATAAAIATATTPDAALKPNLQQIKPSPTAVSLDDTDDVNPALNPAAANAAAGAAGTSANPLQILGSFGINNSAEAAQASRDIALAVNDNLEGNADYIHDLQAGIADALEQEDDAVTLAGVPQQGSMAAKQMQQSNLQQQMQQAAAARAHNANTPALMSAGAARVNGGGSLREQMRARTAAQVAAMNPLGIDRVGAISASEIAPYADSEAQLMAQGHSRVAAYDRAQQNLAKAAAAGDPHALMAGRKRQSTGNGLLSMLSTPLNMAQNIASQATQALRGATMGSVGRGAGGSKAAYAAAHAMETTSISPDDMPIYADLVPQGARAGAAMAGARAPQPRRAQNTPYGASAGAYGAGAAGAAQGQGAARATPPALAGNASGVVNVPVPLETMAAGKMTVDMALAQMEQDGRAGAGGVGAGAAQSAQRPLVRTAGLEDEPDPMAAASALEMVPQDSARALLLGAAGGRNTNSMVGQTTSAKALAAAGVAASGVAGINFSASSRKNPGMSDVMGDSAFMDDSDPNAVLQQAANGGLSAVGELTPEQLETLKTLQSGDTPSLNERAQEAYNPQRQQHYANRQARNAYGMRRHG